MVKKGSSGISTSLGFRSKVFSQKGAFLTPDLTWVEMKSLKRIDFQPRNLCASDRALTSAHGEITCIYLWGALGLYDPDGVILARLLLHYLKGYQNKKKKGANLVPSAQDEARRILPASYVHPCPLGSRGYPFPLNYTLSHLLLLPLNWHPKAGEWLERNALLSSPDGIALVSRRQVVMSVEWMLSALFPAVPCWEDQALQAVWETGALTTGKTVLQYNLKTNSFPICVRKHSRLLPGLYCFCWSCKIFAHRQEGDTSVSLVLADWSWLSSSHGQEEKTHASDQNDNFRAGCHCVA